MNEELVNRLNKIEEDIRVIKVNIQEGFKEAKEERAELKSRINETYNAVNGCRFILS